MIDEVLMKNYVEIIKIGIFYNVFNEDCLIINSLFGYKIINNRCGFPLKNIESVTNKLKDNHINFKYDNEYVKYKDNKYHSILKKIKSKNDIERRINTISECLFDNNELISKVEEICKINC